MGYIRSITTDNGTEFARHKELAEALGTKIYFAHPYSSWEKGLIENLPIKYLVVQVIIPNFAFRLRRMHYGAISIFADVHFGCDLD